MIGQTYTLSFAYAGHPYHPYSGNAFAQVLWDGNVVTTVNRPPSPSDGGSGFVMNYAIANLNVAATQTETPLTFQSLSPNGGILLDAVSLVAVPEPSTTVLTLAGLAVGTIWLRRRRE